MRRFRSPGSPTPRGCAPTRSCRCRRCPQNERGPEVEADQGMCSRPDSGARQMLNRLAELLPTVELVAEEPKAGASRAEQDDVAVSCFGDCLVNRIFHGD